MKYLLAVDDTDSQFGHCTTHLAYRISAALISKGASFTSYPRLVRLNPNIPFKTRGNAAVCLPVECDEEVAFETALRLLSEEADAQNGANPGLVIAREGSETTFFRDLYLKAVSGIVGHRSVLKALEERGIRHGVLGNGMGVVGASASMGFSVEDDHTFELLAYRRREACGTPRSLDSDSVIMMERETHPMTFNNYDHRSSRVLITPHGPDPVFLGIRAASAEVALAAFKMVRYREELLGHMVYVTNQCTDAHLSRRLHVPLVAYSSGWLEGSVAAVALGRGGHLYFSMKSGEQTLRCGIYEPAGDLRRAGGLLEAGDVVRVAGGVRRPTSRHPAILNVERLEVLSVAHSLVTLNPSCPGCRRRMKSEGRGKGFQCRGCGRRSREPRRRVEMERALVPGLYLPSPGAQRHLTKQFVRYGAEDRGDPGPLAAGWIAAPSLSTSPARSRSR